MKIIDGVTYPEPEQWIVATARLDDIGRTLLRVVHGALVLYGVGDRYDRQFVGHGQTAVLEPALKANQLVIVCTKLQLGRPGEQQFQLLKGAIGAAGFQTATYAVELAAPWPIRQGQQPIATTDIDGARKVLWRDALIAWNATLALELGAVSVPEMTHQNEMALGPLQPKDPKGGVASWVFDVDVLL